MNLDIKLEGCVALEVRERNAALSRHVPIASGRGHLAVVGGGPSVAAHLATLQAWPGDLWAINATHRWCTAHGIKAYAYSVDPLPELVDYLTGATSAVLGDHCDPAAFASIRSVYRLPGPHDGPTSAIAAAANALRVGYDQVTFFGCESAFAETTHIDRCESVPDLMRVRCGTASFLTKSEFIIQARELANIIRTFPQYMHEESGGLLRAWMEHGDCEVTHARRGLLAGHEPQREREG